MPTIVGDVIQEAGGTLQIGMEGADLSLYGALAVQGEATL